MDDRIGSVAVDSWEKIRLGTQEMEVADISDYFPFGGEKPYRLVISRIKRRDSQTDMFSGEAYTYRGILTNDLESTNKDIVAFYNDRGKSERLFDVMNNDFGWAKMPCSFLSENTAFMIMTAIFQKTVLAKAKLPAEEIYIPLYHRVGQMDQDREKLCPKALHG